MTQASDEMTVQWRVLVLFVDDDELVRRAFRRTMRRNGITVALAANAVEAIAMMDEAPYRVVVSDLSMPDMDGMTLIAELHTSHPDTAYVLLSGQVQHASIHHGLGGLCVWRTSKPWKTEEIVGLISRLIHRDEAASA